MNCRIFSKIVIDRGDSNHIQFIIDCPKYYNSNCVKQYNLIYQQNYQKMDTNPKLLHQFYKGQKVPPLVTKFDSDIHHQYSESNRQKKYPIMYEVNTHHSITEMYELKLSQKEKEIEKQVGENRELRLIIKELQQKNESFRKINQQMIQRIQQLQARNKNITDNSDRSHRQASRKIRIQVYKQIEDYIKVSIQKFTQVLKSIKMTPLVETRIQQFLQQILNINNVSVRNTLSPLFDSRPKTAFNENEINKTIKEIVHKLSKEKDKQKQQSVEFKDRSVKHERSTSSGNQQREGRKKSLSKRPKIFDRVNNHNEDKFRFRYDEQVRKLDF